MQVLEISSLRNVLLHIFNKAVEGARSRTGTHIMQ